MGIRKISEIKSCLLYTSVNLSPEVLAHQPMVEKYARQNGISNYVYVLLAIIQVESEGKLEDVMQSSESAGLPVNTLGTEDSIKPVSYTHLDVYKRQRWGVV